MKNPGKYFLFVLLMFAINLASRGQVDQIAGIWGTNMHKADQLFEQELYEEAIEYYNKELERYKFDEEALLRIAECYRFLGDYKKMRDYYNIVMRSASVKSPCHTFYYAEGLLSTGKYEDAKNWFEVYLKSDPENDIATARIFGLERLEILFRDSSYLFADTVNFNSDKTDIGPYWYKGGVLFSSGRAKDKIINHDHLRNSEPLLDLYYVKPTANPNDPKRIKISRHWRSNDGPLTIGKSQIIITRNSTNRGDSVHHMGLYTVHEVVNESDLESSWDKIEPFPYNSKEYSIAHPALSEQEDTLVFASDMPGGYGGSDLYYSILVDNGWSKPRNLGDEINTSGNESFPFYKNGTLFFSSNGHPGLGGKDIYKANLISKQVTNLGYPINSGYDDISFIIDDNGEGYFASNRPGGRGKDDIYYFGYKATPPTDVHVVFKDLLNGERISSPSLTIYDIANADSTMLSVDSTGIFETRLPLGIYDIAVDHPDYKHHSFSISISNSDSLHKEVLLDPHFKLENISLDSILFEFNEFRLTPGAQEELDYVIQLMNNYPMVKLQIDAHTDSRGNAEYNLWLSEMRAASTANYLVSKEIAFDRLIFNGYGEFKPLNQCVDGVECDEEDYSVNRRIELYILREE